ncbi:hypothetical protein AVEN_111546-1 [Araneus ventricosus]|uniref:Uncharacterized protein n=1 Tax=Araneus ventricosus TaxID=182803 RepID=A0A4Y2GAN1_ARAVE|nr:hypothetical protein AVEN_51192-1 [Araneus ventricosus]GBM49699.1 hypothetical protein AVEN_111546-1 [Araneus ventricosus]
MIATFDQEKFLTNAKNKSRLIVLLTDKFKAAGISVKQAENDAHVLIVVTALSISKIQDNSIVIVGEDIYLLVILTARTPPNLENFNLKPEKGKMEQRIYSSRSLEGIWKDNILFLRAFSCCDETSAIF